METIPEILGGFAAGRFRLLLPPKATDHRDDWRSFALDFVDYRIIVDNICDHRSGFRGNRRLEPRQIHGHRFSGNDDSAGVSSVFLVGDDSSLGCVCESPVIAIFRRGNPWSYLSGPGEVR